MLNVVNMNAAPALKQHVELTDHFEDAKVGSFRRNDDQRVGSLVGNDVANRGFADTCANGGRLGGLWSCGRSFL